MMDTQRRNSMYQIHISLDGISPPIWRRVIVPASSTLRRFHVIIQGAMGWTNSHLHAFEFDGRRLGRPDPDGMDYVEDDARERLHEVLISRGDSIAYEYDFGDSWRHTILLEEIQPADERGAKEARCIAGARACPPEDCGGLPGYQQLLEAILDPFHPEHREMKQWLGRDFHPDEFDLVQANRKVSRPR